LAASGLTLEDFAGEQLEVYPDCRQALHLFIYMSTQWVHSMNGIAGLNYLVLFHKMDRLKLEPDEYEYLEDDIRTMESTVLKIVKTKPA
jgi:hypothetical protein